MAASVATPPPSATPASSIQINLLQALELLQRHLTQTLCELVFQKVREKEREREWSLFALAQFWTAVIVQAPDSLTQLLQEAQLGKTPLLPDVATTLPAFFKRCKAFHHRFFHALYHAFTKRVLPEAPNLYAPQVHGLLKRFSGIWLVDGSRLDEIAHRMKILWREKTVVLPGCLAAFYDLTRGITRQVLFDPNAASPELLRAELVLKCIPAQTLLLGDRLYASVRFFWELTQHNLWGLFRLNHRLKVVREHLISRRQGGGRTVVEEWLVTVGCGAREPKITLRLILFKQGRTRRELLTNVLDPKMFSAAEALDLYPFRWKVERLFYDLKEVMGLHSFYAANPNAVAMQVYAAAIVHTAFRIAQARIAQAHGIAPDDISTPKLFSRLTVAAIGWVGCEIGFEATREANPDATLKKPDWGHCSFARTTLAAILVQKRTAKRRVLPPRTPMRWKSLAHVRGALS